MWHVCVHKHILFITAQHMTCAPCFGTTQDIHAGLYQPEFQDTASLSYGATAPAKNTRTQVHWQQKHLSTDKDDLFRQKEKQTCKRVKQQRGKELNGAKHNSFLSFVYSIYLFILTIHAIPNLNFTHADKLTYRK